MSYWSAVLTQDGRENVVDTFRFPNKAAAEEFAAACDEFRMEGQRWHVVEGTQWFNQPLGRTMEKGAGGSESRQV